jgi:hypothetical protein
MSIYFSYFPLVAHDLTNEGKNVLLTNIMRRFKVKSSVKDNTSVYYDYDIQAGDRPDTIAEKYYGSSSLAWIVIHYNDIIDPFYGWPLFDPDFSEYIRTKYGSISASQSTVYEYRQILQEKQTLVDGTIIPEKYLVVDQTTYNGLTELERVAVTYWDYEIEENEKKRKIKILDKKYVPQLRAEVEKVLRNNV